MNAIRPNTIGGEASNHKDEHRRRTRSGLYYKVAPDCGERNVYSVVDVDVGHKQVTSVIDGWCKIWEAVCVYEVKCGGTEWKGEYLRQDPDGAELVPSSEGDSQLFRKEMARRQRFVENRRNARLAVNSGSLPRGWTNIREDAGVGRPSRHRAGICTTRREAGW